MVQKMYRNSMRMLILSLFLTLIGCTASESRPVEKQIQTHPAPRYRPRRMVSEDKAVIVAVIDTGLSFSQYTKNAKLCKYGHKNFTTKRDVGNTQQTVDPVPVDHHGHGTNVAGLIQQYAGNANYCMVILKYYDPMAFYDDNLSNTVRAIKHATKIGAKYINYSGGGSALEEDEQEAVKEFIDKGGTFIAAAGNGHEDLAKTPYYPAMDDDRVIVVGSIEKDGSVADYSDFGKRVNRWEYGTKMVGFGIQQTGTSQATAVATGKIIKKECK